MMKAFLSLLVLCFALIEVNSSVVHRELVKDDERDIDDLKNLLTTLKSLRTLVEKRESPEENLIGTFESSSYEYSESESESLSGEELFDIDFDELCESPESSLECHETTMHLKSRIAKFEEDLEEDICNTDLILDDLSLDDQQNDQCELCLLNAFKIAVCIDDSEDSCSMLDDPENIDDSEEECDPDTCDDHVDELAIALRCLFDFLHDLDEDADMDCITVDILCEIHEAMNDVKSYMMKKKAAGALKKIFKNRMLHQ